MGIVYDGSARSYVTRWWENPAIPPETVAKGLLLGVRIFYSNVSDHWILGSGEHHKGIGIWCDKNHHIIRKSDPTELLEDFLKEEKHRWY